ncbi:hypothetical protein CO675_27510 [Bradyrhizobium sp. C9]|nr:hypothetical protein CO675_27510 [Bradyrhizobium sp. C9]
MAPKLLAHRGSAAHRRWLPERSKMDGWLVTVAISKEDSDDDEEVRHVTYAVAVADPAEAVKLIISDSGVKAAMLNCPLEAGMLQSLGLEPGELIVIYDDAIDPIITRSQRH